jgi:putative glutamine amidotransferase
MKPLVGISCCSKVFGPNGLPNHAASDFCVRATAELSGAIPVLLPACGDIVLPDSLLDRLDGILLTGSQSDVEPSLYGCMKRDGRRLSDPRRDATTLPLIRGAVRRGTPILAICRGLQELNVALGGTLHQDLGALPDRLNHEAACPEDPVGRAAPAHWVTLAEGGRLSTFSRSPQQQVNSLHRQAIDGLARDLRMEATAPDGTIEAVSHASAAFVLGVQWHPEFDAEHNLFSASIFRAFGAALHQRESGERLAAD